MPKRPIVMPTNKNCEAWQIEYFGIWIGHQVNSQNNKSACGAEYWMQFNFTFLFKIFFSINKQSDKYY
jgi:hypothetical protein